MSPLRVPITLAQHSYDVVLAPDFDGVGAALSAALARGRAGFRPGRCVVVSNPVVAPLHATAACAALAAGGFDPVMVEVADGESEKHLGTWSRLVDDLLDAGVDRRTPVVALGGGVTGDLVGFAASAALRGVPFVQLPTTLLAMVDASVGGKTGVNTRRGKNLVGAFYQPILVWGALHTLGTLPPEEWRCGLGEVVKHALIAGEDDLRQLEAQAEALREVGTSPLVAELVARSIRTKAHIVMQDEREDGPRAVLNLGHTLAHAIEAVAGPARRGQPGAGVAHGEAVVLGLVAVLRLAEQRGWIEDPGLPDRVERLLRALGLPARAPQPYPLNALLMAAGFDKKRERGRVKLIIPAAPGRTQIREVALEELRALALALPGLEEEKST